jgi:type III secretory pathway lipoprotein EscJ
MKFLTMIIQSGSKSLSIDLTDIKELVIKSIDMIEEHEIEIIFIDKNNVRTESEPLQIKSYDELDNYSKVYFYNPSTKLITIKYELIKNVTLKWSKQ